MVDELMAMESPDRLRDTSALVSVIIPVHNRARLVRAAVESVLEQTHERVEVVPVDDGSTDGTAAVLQMLAASDPRVKVVIQHQNRGAQAARNAGIVASSGSWIGFLDS